MPTPKAERRVIYSQRKESGCCPRCGAKKRKTDKFTYCNACREFFRGYNREISEHLNEARRDKYEERKQNHQCPRCGKKLGKRYTKIMCAACLSK